MSNILHETDEERAATAYHLARCEYERAHGNRAAMIGYPCAYAVGESVRWLVAAESHYDNMSAHITAQYQGA